MTKTTERFKMKTAVYILLRRDDKVLLAQRKNTGYQDGNYGLPAGHMDGDELATHTAAREAKEEVGVAVDPKDLRLIHVTHRLDTGISSERIELLFEAKTWKGEPTNAEPDKCDNVRWFPITQLPPNIIPLVQSIIQLSDKGIVYSEYPEELQA